MIDFLPPWQVWSKKLCSVIVEWVWRGGDNTTFLLEKPPGTFFQRCCNIGVWTISLLHLSITDVPGSHHMDQEKSVNYGQCETQLRCRDTTIPVTLIIIASMTLTTGLRSPRQWDIVTPLYGVVTSNIVVLSERFDTEVTLSPLRPQPWSRSWDVIVTIVDWLMARLLNSSCVTQFPRKFLKGFH